MTERSSKHRFRHAVIVALLVSVSGSSVGSEEPADDQDWPCIQHFVPRVEAAVIWPGVIDEAIAGRWIDDDEIAGLARELGDGDELTEEASAQIADWVGGIDAADRERRVNMLADGILSVANERRELFMDGIKRYTRQQTAVAKQIEEHRNKLHELDVANVTADDPERQEVEETVHWHQRVFDNRERAITLLCEQPVAVEVYLGEVLRDLAQHLP